nr:unnamed protein product [Digitaria exilis]
MAHKGEKPIIDALREALLHFAVKSKKLASPLLEPFGRTSVPPTVDDDELTTLKSKLRRIHATLRDAENLSVTDHSVQLWLAELGDLEHRAEDVLEELEYESRRSAQLEELKQELFYAAATGKRRREVAQLFTAAPARRLRRKIDDIWARYEEIASDRKKLRLRPSDGAPRPVVSALIPSSVLPRGCSDLHGRERDIERVAALVRAPAENGRSYAVVPIVGMAGVGKTALVQQVCNMEDVRSHFDMTFWIWVSQEFDVVNVTRKIVEAITRSRPECDELSTLHELMVEHIAGKRCLIVLDDVWDENPIHWDSLTAPLSRCAAGSTVVVTTRSKKVAKMASPKVYHLKCMTDDDCWLLCRQRALPNSNSNIDQQLVEIGKQITKKCGGLPLAAEAAGSALSSSISWNHWKEVLENDLWACSEAKNLILPVLKVSYDHLSVPLKRCFAFCSLFPKGFTFDKDVLVQLWTAQGFVDAERDCGPEFIANGYFNDLVSRCFFNPSPAHGLSNLNDAQAAAANLWNKLGIQKLTLEWSELTNFKRSLCDLQENAVSSISHNQDPGFGAVKDHVLKCLKPHSNLEELSIKHYNGSFSPTWSGWLPLDRNMKAWEEWCGVKSEHFPNLKYVSIARCSKLKLLPKFTSEPKLRIRNCDLLQMPLCQKYMNMVKHIPAQSEISYTCITEGDILVLEASCSYGA